MVNIFIIEQVKFILCFSEGKYSALVSYTGYLKKNDSIWISKRGSNISNGDNCDGSCQVFNYLEIMLYTF